MKLYVFIFISSFFLLLFNINEKAQSFRRNPKKSPVAHAFILGDKSGITYSQKKDLKSLGALHLLTPSGLHLSSFMGFLTLLLVLLKREKLKLPILIIAGIALLFLPTFYSLKRTLFFSILGLALYEKWGFTGKSKLIFIFVFMGDFLFGSFNESPLSFTFSYLFFGTFIALSRFGYKTLFTSLFLNQILISYFLVEKFYLIGPLFGFLLTSLFSFLFPIGLILFPVDLLTNFSPSSFIFSSFLNLVHLFAQLAMEGPVVMISLCTVVCMLFGFCTKNLRWVLPLLLLEAQPLYNIPLSAFKKSPRYSDYKLNPEDETLKVEKVRRGYRTWHPHQIKCNVTLYTYFWEKKCQLHNKTI